MTAPTARALGLLHGLLARPLASYHLLLASSGLLLVIGLTMVFSATSVEAYATGGSAFAAIAEQASYALVGLAAFWLCQRLPVRTLRVLALPLLLVAFVLQGALAVVALLHGAELISEPRLGPVVSNLQWLRVGGLSVQPSELAKLALVLWVADVFARKGARLADWRELARPLFPVAGLMLLLVGYHDLGTALVLAVLLVGMMWAAGIRLRVFGALGLLAGIGVALLVLAQRDYRLERFTAFLDPECNQMVECYQAIQGRRALADGGWFGVGLGSASYKWGWLPAGHNDFIFAVIGEELGVVGCLVVIALFAVLAYTGLRIARRVGVGIGGKGGRVPEADRFRRLVAAGVVAWLVGQTVINIGGVVGLLPITGLPLPFISAGGSALVVTLAAVGMLAAFARAEPAAARALHARPPARWVQLLWAPLPPLPKPKPHSKPKEKTSERSQRATSR